MSVLEELAKTVAAKAGIETGQATTATNMAAGFLTDKLPAPLAEQVNSALGTPKLTGVAGDLVNAVAEKTGLPKPQAEMAVRTVADELKKHLPPPMAENIYPLLGLGGTQSGDLAGMLGSLMGGGAGGASDAGGASGALGSLLGGLMGSDKDKK